MEVAIGHKGLFEGNHLKRGTREKRMKKHKRGDWGETPPPDHFERALKVLDCHFFVLALIGACLSFLESQAHFAFTHKISEA